MTGVPEASPSSVKGESPVAPSTSWTQLAIVALAAAVTVVAVDRYATRRCRDIVLSQVDDGVRLLEATNPVAIAFGSSQARSFEVVDALLAERTGGQTRVATVAIEDGRITTAAWVLEHRLAPLIEATGKDGKRVRDQLRHVIFITDWWDSIASPDGRTTPHGIESKNLPARAWTLSDFIADVRQNGLTDFNKNFVAAAWSNLFGDSVLVRDRGYGLMLRMLKEGRLEMSRAEHLEFIDQKRKGIENNSKDVCAPQEMTAFAEICDCCRDHGLKLTVVLYPAMVETVSPLARATTLQPFADAAAALCKQRGVDFFDWTYSSPLQFEDFRDHAHLNPAGHRKLAEWVLSREGDLAPLFHP